MGSQSTKESYIGVISGIRYFTKQMKKKTKESGGSIFGMARAPPLSSFSPLPCTPWPEAPKTLELLARRRERERERARQWVTGGTIAAGGRLGGLASKIRRRSAVTCRRLNYAGVEEATRSNGRSPSPCGRRLGTLSAATVAANRKRRTRTVAVNSSQNPNATQSKVSTHKWVL